MSTRFAPIVCVLAVVLGGLGAASAHAAPASTALQGNVQPALDVPPVGKVAVVAAGAAVDGKVAVIVQNGSSKSVKSIQVLGMATRSDGGAVTQAKTRITVPATLGPGAIALTSLDFRKDGVPPGATVNFRVTSSRSASGTDTGLLTVSALALSAPLTGAVAQRLDATVSNPSARAVPGPVRVTVMCFNEARKPVVVVTTTVKSAKLKPRQSIHASVPLATLCPTYLVGAHTAA